MAISRGAGTEIIRSIQLDTVDGTARNVIYGVQHHIYTVLSIMCFARVLATEGNYLQFMFTGYDSTLGASGQDIRLLKHSMSSLETFVWNDKFSFNGYEPVDFAGEVDSEAKQDALADQGSSVRQSLAVVANAGDTIDVFCTYIDQNNA
jgi:hypothetical protein